MSAGDTPPVREFVRPPYAGWLPRVALLLFAIGVFAYRDSLMDDTFIHLVYARNLRATGRLEFNSGEPSLGATSPLWMLLLAGAGASETAARLLSVGCGALSVLVFTSLAQRVVGRNAWAWAATMAWAGSLWLVRHAPNGMETVAAALAVIVCVELRARGGRHAGRDVGFGAALAGAALLRPECVALAVVFLVQDARSGWGRARLAAWLPAFALPIAAWIVFAHARTGAFIPVTGAAKSGGFHWAPAAWLHVLWREARVLGGAHAVELAGLVLAPAVALRRGRPRLAPAWFAHPLVPYGLFSVFVLGVYTVGDLQLQPRYLVPILPCVVLAGFIAWRRLLGDGARGAIAIATASLAVGAFFGARTVYPATRDFGRGLRDVLKPMALDVKQRGLRHPVVASPDIGVFGYYSGARILDLGGLVDPRVQTIVHQIGYDAMLEHGLFLDLGTPDFIVDRSPQRERFAGLVTRGLRWRVLRTGEVRGLGISRPQIYYYTLYALDPASAFGSNPIDLDVASRNTASR